MYRPMHGQLCVAIEAILAGAAVSSDVERALRPWARWATAVHAGVYSRLAATRAVVDAEAAEALCPSRARRLARAARHAATAALHMLDDDPHGAGTSLEAAQAMVEGRGHDA